MEVRFLEEAQLWLRAAIYITESAGDAAARHAVGVAMAVHAILKANDALTLRFLSTTARRHDDARRLFEEMVRAHHIRPAYADSSNLIQDAINDKARAEYRGGVFSKRDSDRLLAKAERFLAMARLHLEN